MQWGSFSILNHLVGKALRKLPSQNAVFLSFDDGPDPDLSPRVLDLLKEYGVKATFFVIAQKAEKYPQIIQRIQREGHAIGNHSLDHHYSPFFKGPQAIYKWVDDAEKLLKKIGIHNSVGFRPPVGIRTPELARALKKLELPLILWEQRSFDKVIKFTAKRARSLAKRTQAGDIILLHDVQREEWHDDFLLGLKTLIEELGKKSIFLPKIEISALKQSEKVIRLIDIERKKRD